MDAKGGLRYGAATMRLLLLLSAILTALAGVGGTRAEARAQPVAVTAPTAVAAATAALPVALRPFAAGYPSTPPALPPLPRLIGAAAARLLYAERRRE